jgi:HlyD family secretion protein
MKKGYYSQNKDFMEREAGSLQQIGQTIRSQLAIKNQDLEIAMESFNMNKKLYEEKVITNQEYRVEKSKLLAKQDEIPQLNASLLTNQNEINEKLKEIKEVDHSSTQQNFIFSQALLLFKSQIDSWIKKYMLISPIDGKIYFVIPIQENQYLQNSKLIGYINPLGGKLYAETYMSQVNFGRVHVGLPVQLRFDAYPYQEFGYIEGEVNYISNVPSENGFLVTIRLKNGLLTNNKKVIPYRNGLKANALIITKKSRLAERFYYNIVKSLSVGSN